MNPGLPEGRPEDSSIYIFSNTETCSNSIDNRQIRACTEIVNLIGRYNVNEIHEMITWSLLLFFCSSASHTYRELRRF